MQEQGYYGTEGNPIEDLYSERKVMTPQTSGGALEEGEYRLRTDLNSGDRIAAYELNVGNGTQEAPVYPLSESVGPDIVKARHVYVPGEGWGFVPLGDTSAFSPAFEEFVFWHGGTRYGWHDSLTAIPDSGIFQNALYRFQYPSVSSSNGETGFALPEVLAGLSDASAVGGPTYHTDQGGTEAGEYDGADDGHDVPSNSSAPTGSDDFAIAALVWLQSTSGPHRIYHFGDSGFSAGQTAYFDIAGGELRLILQGGDYASASGGSPSTGSWITVGATTSNSGQNSEIFLNGSSVGTASGNSPNLANDVHGIAYDPGLNSNFFDGYVGDVILCDGTEAVSDFQEYHNEWMDFLV